MTKQDVFNTVAKHLIEQGEPSAYGTDAAICRYRHTSPDGKQLSCALGCLIPDVEYNDAIEGAGIHGLTNDHHLPSMIKLVNDVGIEFLDRLQCAHDRAADIMAWHSPSWDQAIRAQLFELAKSYELDFTVLGDVSALREAS